MLSSLRSAKRLAVVDSLSSRAAWARKIVAVEDMCEYPLGSDSFKLDHGKDYFAFFDRLGEATHFVLPDDAGNVAGQVSILIETVFCSACYGMRRPAQPSCGTFHLCVTFD